MDIEYFGPKPYLKGVFSGLKYFNHYVNRNNPFTKYFSYVMGPTKMRKSRKMRKDAQIPWKMRKDVCKFYSEGFAHFTRY